MYTKRDAAASLYPSEQILIKIYYFVGSREAIVWMRNFWI